MLKTLDIVPNARRLLLAALSLPRGQRLTVVLLSFVGFLCLSLWRWEKAGSGGGASHHYKARAENAKAKVEREIRY